MVYSIIIVSLHMGRMTASQDSHAISSVVKESIVRGHHVYKVAAASLVVFSAHSTAFNLKETSYDFLLGIALATLMVLGNCEV